MNLDNVDEILSYIPNITACLDAIDGASAKTALIAACVDRRIPIVTCGGAAGRKDPTRIRTQDLNRVQDDRLLGACRKNLRKYHGFSEGLPYHIKKAQKTKPRKWGIQAVYSSEIPKPLPKGENDKVSALRRCDGALGTACFVTGSLGFVAASRVVDMIANDRFVKPRRV